MGQGFSDHSLKPNQLKVQNWGRGSKIVQKYVPSSGLPDYFLLKETKLLYENTVLNHF